MQQEQEKRKNIESALKGLIKLIKAAGFYPPAHPALKAATAEAHGVFTQLLKDGSPLCVLVRREGFSLDETPVGSENPVLKKLSAFLFSRRIQRLTILPDLTVRDLKAFASCLLLEPATVLKMGGIQEVFQKAHISTIWINEVDMTKIESRKKELEAEKERLFTPEGADSEEPLFALQPETIEDGSEEPSEERNLKKIIAELQRERSDHRFRQLLEEFVPLIPPNLTESGRFSVLDGLALLCKNAGGQQSSDLRRQHARHTLKQILNDQLLDFLISFLCARDLSRETRDQLSRVLAFLGGNAGSRLMERLAGEDDAQRRKILSDALIRHGAAAVPVLIAYLGDDRWYVVRNAVGILGEIRAQIAVSHFHPLLGHPDIRVRRETIRALTRIGGNDAVDILLQIVKRGDPDLRPHALLSLGAMKNPTAVPTLVKIVGQPDPWVKKLEIKKEAIRALGEIGSDEALPSLIAVLKHRKLWRRAQFNELRATAAMALGDIGHPGAADTLKKATEDRSQAVARAALQALKQLRKG